MPVTRKPTWRNAIETMDLDAFLESGNPEEAVREMEAEKTAKDYWSTTEHFSGPSSGWIGILPADPKTVEFREQLRAMGCRYDQILRMWYAHDFRVVDQAYELLFPRRRKANKKP